ncbi:uncharacterized protein LOC142624872 [Castanea sativa]|uniref:uncharacterized protein LOC142624872 n=1 Tax=Castanea sativa TaxID=21020 RepID=UPI003F64A76B
MEAINHRGISHSKTCPVWQLAKSSLEDYVGSALWDFSYPRAPPSCWVPPPHGFYKINVDGASSNLENSSSIGVVIRDSFGQVVAAVRKPLQACFTAEITEVMALEQGVLLAQEIQLSRVIFESDSLNAIQAVKDKASGSNYGHIVQGILQVSESFETCCFKLLSRNFNSVAHELALLARRSGTQHLWIGVTPPCVTSFIQADLM